MLWAGKGGLYIQETDRSSQRAADPIMTIESAAPSTIPDSELVLKFESLGDNCELGLVQRRMGAEPLGLLRFAGTPLRHLVRAMEARFEGLADPAGIRIQPENGEYMVKLTKYDFVYHADVKIGEIDPEVLHKQQSRTIGFLVRKFIEDLENPTKIMVFRQNEPLLAEDLTDLRLALASYGPATLLWVQAARPGHPPNTVVKVDDRLMVGFVRQLAPRNQVPDLDVESWMAMLRKAYAMSIGAAPDPTAPRPRTEIVFGKDGNAAGCTGYGWSAHEDGYTWSTGDRSLLTIQNPGPADEFWLEFDVVPFVAPPVLPAQSMGVTVNGELIQVFDPLVRGKVGCIVPGRHLQGLETVAIVLDHPKAAIPRDLTGVNDDRRLAVAFRRLSLTAH
jgi:hypothetical protein